MKTLSIIPIFTACVFGLLQEAGAETDAASQKNALKKNLHLAQAGDAAAQVEVGMAYDSGRGIEKNPSAALEWYHKAAAQGNGNAMIQIAHVHEAGTGVEKNIGVAMEWFQKALATPQQSAAGWNLVRLSRAGLIKEKYVGIPVEVGLVTIRVDETIPIAEAVESLATNTQEIETGKAYWIGYNPQMLAVGARGEAAIPVLKDFITNSSDPKVRGAGLLALHLVGIGCVIDGRFHESFTNRKAREAFWTLMKVEGLTDDVTNLLKRDPWPADVPAIMDALAAVKSDCPRTLNALLRYPLSKRPIDTGSSGLGVRFTIPAKYTDRDFVRLAIEGIKANQNAEVKVEEGALDQIPAEATYGNPTPHQWEGSLDTLLGEIKDLSPTFNYTDPGRRIYYYFDQTPENDSRQVLHFCTAATAKKRWLDWWQKSGREWYSHEP